jgi:membrane-associated phospholipid phosphatase
MAYRETVGATTESVAVDARDLLFGPEPIEALRDLLPAPAVEAFALATHLGDGAVLAAVAVACYWLAHGRREEYAFVVAVGLGAFALVSGLKAIFVHPRPSEELWLVAEANYGFPSAHALGSTVVWGTLAYVSRIGTRTQRYAAAALVVGVVSLSRVVIGVHFLGDVLGGVLIGACYLAAMARYTRHDPTAAFAVAAGLSLVMALLAPNQYTAATVGGSVGALAAWSIVRSVDRRPSTTAVATVVVVAAPLALGIETLVLGPGAPFALETLAGAAIAAGVLLVPSAAATLDSSDAVRRVRGRLRRLSPSS